MEELPTRTTKIYLQYDILQLVQGLLSAGLYTGWTADPTLLLGAK